MVVYGCVRLCTLVVLKMFSMVPGGIEPIAEAGADGEEPPQEAAKFIQKKQPVKVRKGRTCRCIPSVSHTHTHSHSLLGAAGDARRCATPLRYTCANVIHTVLVQLHLQPSQLGFVHRWFLPHSRCVFVLHQDH